MFICFSGGERLDKALGLVSTIFSTFIYCLHVNMYLVCVYIHQIMAENRNENTLILVT